MTELRHKSLWIPAPATGSMRIPLYLVPTAFQQRLFESQKGLPDIKLQVDKVILDNGFEIRHALNKYSVLTFSFSSDDITIEEIR